MDLVQALYVLRRRLWLLIAAALVSALTAYLVVGQLPPRYRTSALLQVDASAEQTVAAVDLGTSERLTLTYATLLNTRAVLEAAAADLGLLPETDLAAVTVSAEALRNTQLMRVTVEDSDPDRAAALANAIGRVFAEQTVQLQRTRFADARLSLTNELYEVQAQIEQTQMLLSRAPANLDPLQSVQQEELLTSYRTTYGVLLQSSEDIRLAELQDATTIHLVDAAVAPHSPLGPFPLPSALLAALGGLVFGAALALALEFLRDRVTDQSVVERLLGTDVLAVIDVLPGRRADDRLVALRRDWSAAAEAFRMLRVRLEIARYGKPMRLLLVTSTQQGEGKTTTAANLAVTIARTGKKVVLIDADLRRPALHELFNHQNIRGLTTAMHAGPTADPAPHLLSTRVDTLQLMPAGPSPADPTLMLGSPDLGRLFQRLLSDADLLIVDSPPLLQVADSALLLSLCDTVLLVALAGQTRTSWLVRAAGLVRQTRREIAGVVLNRASMTTLDGNQRYGYYGSTRAPKKAATSGWGRWWFALGGGQRSPSATARDSRPRTSAREVSDG